MGESVMDEDRTGKVKSGFGSGWSWRVVFGWKGCIYYWVELF
jgi:hypothetical protein